MTLMKRINKRFKSEDNTGFGARSSDSGGRFYNRKGGANVTLRGVNIFSRYSWYHTMLEMSRTKFLALIFCIYIIVNLLFAGIYYLIGIEHLAGVNTGSSFKNFTEVFFFSTQTFTTVGYGRISPTGFLTSSVATFEAFIGLLSFAIATGLFYGRFSRPQAFLKFSHNALIAPYKEGIALMFRMAPYKNNHLSDGETKVTLAMRLEENGKRSNRFYSLDLEISKINALALSWTLVHVIDESSPLHGFSLQDMKNAEAEILVFVKAFDQVFSNTVMTRTSYVASEIIWGARFKIMYHPSEDKTTTILDMNKLNAFERVAVPDPVAAI
jgi:inward rectifier potassium channel